MILPVLNYNFNKPNAPQSRCIINTPNLSGYSLHAIPCEPDTFECSLTALDKDISSSRIEKSYKKIEDSLQVIKADDIEKIAAKVKSAFPDIDNKEIYSVMGAMSEYSSYASMQHIASDLYTKGISEVFDFSALLTYQDKTVKEKTQNPFSMDAVLKIKGEYSPKVITHIPQKLGVPLGCVLDYLTFFKYPMNYGRKKAALILDKNSIKLFQKIKSAEPDAFKRDFLNNEMFVPVYIDNFENSYNFLNQGKSFEQEVFNFTEKYRTLKGEHPEFSHQKLLDVLFNSQNLKAIKELGFTPLHMQPKHTENIDSQTIAQNLRPVMPTKEQFIDFVQTFAKHSRNVEPELMENILLDYLNKNLAVYSPASLSQKLKILHKKIIQSVKEKGYPTKNIYYTVLNPNKSFGLIAYQFQNVNNIPDDKIIYWKGSSYNARTDLKLPEKSTIVILDDCFISGNTIMYEMFNYQAEASNIKTQRDDTNILFASVLSTNAAQNRIKKNIQYASREKADDFVNVDTQKINWPEDLKQDYANELLKLIRFDKHILATTAIVFPYMGSDTNAPGLHGLFAQFVPNRNYLHNEVSEDDFFDD